MSEPSHAPSGEQIIQRFEDLKARRGTWEAHWQEVLDVTLPRKADVTVARSTGAKRTEKMFDATAVRASTREQPSGAHE